MNRLTDWWIQRFSHCSVLLSQSEWHRGRWITPPPIPFLQVASCINITDSSVIHNRGKAAHTVAGVSGFYTAPRFFLFLGFFSDSGARTHGLLGGIHLWSQQSYCIHDRAIVQEEGGAHHCWEVGRKMFSIIWFHVPPTPFSDNTLMSPLPAVTCVQLCVTVINRLQSKRSPHALRHLGPYLEISRTNSRIKWVVAPLRKCQCHLNYAWSDKGSCLLDISSFPSGLVWHTHIDVGSTINYSLLNNGWIIFCQTFSDY